MVVARSVVYSQDDPGGRLVEDCLFHFYEQRFANTPLQAHAYRWFDIMEQDLLTEGFDEEETDIPAVFNYHRLEPS